MIYLQIPNYPDPQAPGQTFTAYAPVASLFADFINGRGRLILRLYRTLEAMQDNAQYVADLIIQDGQRIIEDNSGPTYPRMTQIESDNIQAWSALWQYFLTKAITLTKLSGATIETT